MLRVGDPAVRLLEPVRAAGTPGVSYRLARRHGLGKPVASQFGGAVLLLLGNGGLLVRLAGGDSASWSLRGGWWPASGDVLCLSGAFRHPDGVWDTFDGVIVSGGGELRAVSIDGHRATIAEFRSRLSVETSPAGWADLPVPGEPGTDDGLPNACPVAAVDVDLAEAELSVLFDRHTYRIDGVLRVRSEAGEAVRGTLAGRLRGWAVQRFRERIARPDIGGSWSSVLGPVADREFPGPGEMNRGGPPRVALDERGGFGRLAPALDLVVGLDLRSGDPEFVALRRERAEVPEFGAADRQALRYLGQDLVAAGRLVEAIPLLDRAAALIEEAADTAARTRGTGSEAELISLVMLLNYQVRCAFRVRDYPALLGCLRRAVLLRERLSGDALIRRTAGQIERTILTAQGVIDPMIAALTAQSAGEQGAADNAAQPSAAVALGGLGDVLRAAAGVLAGARRRAAALTADSPIGETELRPAIGRLESALASGETDLRALAPRCLDDAAGLFAQEPDLVQERDRLVRLIDGGHVSSVALSEVETTEQRLTEMVSQRTALSPAARALMLAQKDAATAVLMSANLLAQSRQFLARADPAAAAADRRQGSQEAASRLSGYIEQWRRLLDDDRERVLAVEGAREFYDVLVGMLLNLGAVEEALIAAELSRARAIADLLEAQRGSPGAPDPASVLSVADARALVARLGHPVVLYFAGEAELVIWLIPPAGPVQCVRQPVPQPALEAAVGRLDSLVRRRSAAGIDELGQVGQETTSVLAELSAILWHPLGPILDQWGRVTIVPDLQVFRVPVAALTSQAGEPVVRRHAVTFVPALSVLAHLLDSGQRDLRKGRMLALVDPAPMPLSLGALTWTRENFGAVTALYPETACEVRTGPEATADQLRRSAGNADVILLATHAEAADGSRPGTESYVALAPADGHDGLLRIADISGLALSGVLVMLLGCRSGGGRISGEGVLGLSRAFLIEGAASLMLTLQEVGEQTSLDLAYRFLDEWRHGARMDDAFRQAQAGLAEEFPDDPAAWAPFVLYGTGW